MKKKELGTFWTVIWTMEGRKEYEVPKNDHGIVPMVPEQSGIMFNVSDTKKGRPKMRWADVYPMFETRKEAEAYREGNEDWEVIGVFISKV